MLPTQKDIADCRPPFLLKYPSGDWSVITKIMKHKEEITFHTLYTELSELLQSKITIKEKPFYVGADIWELNYGSIIMTLKHPTLAEHPATKLWNKFKLSGQAVLQG